MGSICPSLQVCLICFKSKLKFKLKIRKKKTQARYQKNNTLCDVFCFFLLHFSLKIIQWSLLLLYFLKILTSKKGSIYQHKILVSKLGTKYMGLYCLWGEFLERKIALLSQTCCPFFRSAVNSHTTYPLAPLPRLLPYLCRF